MVASARAGENTLRIAERVLDADDALVRMPEHVRDLRDAARAAKRLGDPNLYEDAVRSWQRRINRLGQGAARKAGQFTVRSATQQLVKDLRKAKLEDIDKVVDRWTLERARFQARMIARTEVVETYRESYRRSTQDQPYVVGYRWVLSGRHSRPDECDLLASQDLDGLGPGGYTVDGLPSNPHPDDQCSQVAIIDTDHFAREEARLTGQEEPPRPWESGQRVTAEDWLKKQPPEYRRQLLGPTRKQMLDEGKTVLRQRTAKPIPVYELQGRPRPERRLGPPVPTSPIVVADRRVWDRTSKARLAAR